MKTLYLAIFAFFASIFSLSALAAGTAPDWTVLTAGIDFSSLITALLTVFAAMAGVGIVAKGGAFLVKKLGF